MNIRSAAESWRNAGGRWQACGVLWGRGPAGLAAWALVLAGVLSLSLSLLGERSAFARDGHAAVGGDGASLILVINGVQPERAGHLAVAVFREERKKAFPLKAMEADYAILIRPHNDQEWVTLQGLKPGKRYAVAVFHDANDDGKLNRNWLTAPMEGVGFSSGAEAYLVVPGFSLASFVVGRESGQVQSVTLQYP